MPPSLFTTVTPADVQNLARRLALESPRLTDLTPAQLDHIAQVVIFSGLRDDLKRMAALSSIDLPAELKTFLSTASPTGSWRTLETYGLALARFEHWLKKKGIEFLEVTPRQADDYIYSLRAEARSSSTIRIEAAAPSAFFSFLERRYDAVRNPFRGSRARPAHRPCREVLIPTAEELSLMVVSSSPFLRAALSFMSRRGFRVGSLPTLVLSRGRFSGWSKGKAIEGELPDELVESLDQAGLDRRRPFEGYTSAQLSDRVLTLTNRLKRQGRLSEAYSAHDLRHYYAVSVYRATPDLYRLKVLLGHHSVAVTERYLRGMHLLE